MTASTSAFTDLITTEHQDKPKFVETVALSCQGFADQIALCQQAYDLYDIDDAEGVQLDAVGLWVGTTRMVALDVDIYFSWDTSGVGWDQGIWWEFGDPESSVTELSDADYRKILKVKIECNNSDGSLPSATKILQNAVADSGATVTADDGDMNVQFVIQGDVSVTMRAIIMGGYLPIKAAGIGIGYTILSKTIPKNDWGSDIL